MKYQKENEAKACFDNIYTAATPHAYIEMMEENDYEISEQARPYCMAAVDLLKNRNGGDSPVQLLDIGCSYGMGSAFFKYGRSFDEMVAFFSKHASRDYDAACQAMRKWLNVKPASYDMRCVGFDSSIPAIRFAKMSGLLDDSIARDFENPEVLPNAEERTCLSRCNLMVSTGAIGYITDSTMEKIVPHVGADCPDEIGPFAVFTILRMFDPSPIQAVFEKHGFRLEKVSGVLLPQRRFTDENEQKSVLSLLRGRGVDTTGKEDQGKHLAELFIGAKPGQFSTLLEKISETHSVLSTP